MRLVSCLAAAAAICAWSDSAPGAFIDSPKLPALRAPAVPLIVHDPYFSVWSATDRLTDSWPTHWTGASQGMCGMVRIDGKAYRFMGLKPEGTPAIEQTGVQAWPTRTCYDFATSSVALRITFWNAALPENIEVLSRPVTYVRWNVRSLDGATHRVSVYLDACGELVTSDDQTVEWSRARAEGLTLLRMGRDEQKPLSRAGDRVRIDWGYLYLGIPTSLSAQDVFSDEEQVRKSFAETGKLPPTDDLRMPRRVSSDWPVMAAAVDLGEVGQGAKEATVLLGYEDVLAIEFLGRRLKPYWQHDGIGVAAMLAKAAAQRDDLYRKCETFDALLTRDLVELGGPGYAALASLAYRECLGGGKIAADFDGAPLLFPKENSSNGCISTVDVFYPSSPFFLLLNPTLMKAQTTPILVYAASARWKWPFAPHDLGTFPLANGQRYGGGEKTEENQMPVEESGNMLILLAAISKLDGNTSYAEPYWPTITKWAKYLKEKGLDPENQLCTDDFAGHLAHNANLSVKAILGIASYGLMCDLGGRKAEAEEYRTLAKQMAAEWMRKADDGDHYRLTFDRPGTWSQKYNLVWDEVLGLGVFPPEVAAKEIAFYRTKINEYGLPLDGRATYAKVDWTVWMAAMTKKREDFEALVSPLVKFANKSPDRSPLADWYDTKEAKICGGFAARPVIGGVYMPMLTNAAIWEKWARWGGREFH